MRNYRSVKLRKELVDAIEKHVNGFGSGLGYTSIADFVTDAARMKLERQGGL